jgi:serine/threonine protein kinase
VTVYIELAAHKRSLLGPNRQRHYLEMVDRGIYAENFYYLVMTMAGPSLDALRRIRPGKRFSMGTSLVLARQTLESLQQLHKVGFLHRDVSPATSVFDGNAGTWELSLSFRSNQPISP